MDKETSLALIIGQQLKQLRKEHYPHDDQTAFGLRLGISKNTYSRIETGQANPSLSVLVKLAALYDLEDRLAGLFVKPKPQNLFDLRGKKQ